MYNGALSTQTTNSLRNVCANLNDLFPDWMMIWVWFGRID
jgi:hypothetical protein